MVTISLKLSDELVSDSEECARALRLSRAEYIRRAIERMNRETRARLRAARLAEASERSAMKACESTPSSRPSSRTRCQPAPHPRHGARPTSAQLRPPDRSTASDRQSPPRPETADSSIASSIRLVKRRYTRCLNWTTIGSILILKVQDRLCNLHQ